jgi:leader peptidase (prepilin peptidase)/N-methyltransferase
MVLIETLFLVITFGLFGLVIGSFLNVCIYRIPRDESIAFPSSHCTTCGHSLQALDLIPVFSYIFLRGKCRYCKSKISPRYMLVETLHSLLYMIVVAHFGLTIESIIYCFLSSIMLVLTMINLLNILAPELLGMEIQITIKVRFVVPT